MYYNVILKHSWKVFKEQDWVPGKDLFVVSSACEPLIADINRLVFIKNKSLFICDHV